MFNKEALTRITQQRYMKLMHTTSVENDWMEADVEFHTLESACEILLGYGALARVLEPSELRDRVILEAKVIIVMYSEGES
ncbi:hypothetical protein D3C77_521980 [compost metagenome]